jgi:translation initiation factor 3 subunit I
LISASADNTAKLFMTKNLKLLKTYTSGEPVNIAAISPLKLHVIVGGGTDPMEVTQTSTKDAFYEVRFFNEIYEEEIGTIKGHFGPIHGLEFSPDGKSYASGGEDGIVRLQ